MERAEVAPWGSRRTTWNAWSSKAKGSPAQDSGRGSTCLLPALHEVVEIRGAASCLFEALGRQDFTNGNSVLILQTVSPNVRMSVTTGLPFAGRVTHPSLCELMQALRASLLFKAVSEKVSPAPALGLPSKAVPHSSVFCSWWNRAGGALPSRRVVCPLPPQAGLQCLGSTMFCALTHQPPFQTALPMISCIRMKMLPHLQPTNRLGCLCPSNPHISSVSGSY